MLRLKNILEKSLGLSGKTTLAKEAIQKKATNRLIEIADNAIFIGFSIVVLRFLVLYVISEDPLVHVGDVLVFETFDSPNWKQGMEISARHVAGALAAPGARCELRMPSAAGWHAVLTVIAIRPDGVVLSWMEDPAGFGKANCGSNARVLITKKNYNRLLQAETPDVLT